MKKLGCDYQRILIIGSGGSGKSTLTEKLSPLTNLPAVHLDALYWRENWQHVETEEFDRLLEAQLSKEKWILDGNFNRTLEMRLKSADFVIYLDFPAPICVWGVIKRVLRYHGNTRPDMGKGCPEKFDLTYRVEKQKRTRSVFKGLFVI